jgi:peptidyl-tRNA hydrolase, PTH1 family
MAKLSKNKPIFIVGLGNPGEQYRNTPHSAGFTVVDGFAKRFDFPDFKMEPDGILVSQKELCGRTVILAKPQMFMNNSGKALAKLLARQKIRKAKSYPNLWVINDDLDLPLGKIKIGQNRGSAGHKGVQSIIDQLKTKNFVRLRVGIQTPEAAGKSIPGHKFVLKKISPKEQIEFDKVTDMAVSALQIALADGIDKAMTAANQ